MTMRKTLHAQPSELKGKEARVRNPVNASSEVGRAQGSRSTKLHLAAMHLALPQLSWLAIPGLTCKAREMGMAAEEGTPPTLRLLRGELTSFSFYFVRDEINQQSRLRPCQATRMATTTETATTTATTSPTRTSRSRPGYT
mmetsp:Transcript_12113/g.26698  ORF Transcript_12113/g.26698 Transcript_12113/m.26698 type:complete len:141 (+) Transcript_12113:552-974(+)